MEYRDGLTAADQGFPFDTAGRHDDGRGIVLGERPHHEVLQFPQDRRTRRIARDKLHIRGRMNTRRVPQ